MVRLRAEKVEKIADYIAPAEQDSGPAHGKVLVLGWGSTYGAIKTVMNELHEEGYLDIAHIHLRHLNPFPKNLCELLANYERILIPEMNTGQLLQLIKAKYLVAAAGFSKVQGQPFDTDEIKAEVLALYNKI